MAFVFVPNMRGGKSPTSKTTITVFKKSKGASNPQISFKISLDDMKRNRWVIGDRLNVAFDSENPCFVFLQRTPKGGFAISCGEGAEANGKTVAGNCKFTIPSHLPFLEGDKFSSWSTEVTPDGFLVTFEKMA